MEVSLTNDSSSTHEQVTSSAQSVPEHSFTLLDLYERATISGNSLASELGLYLYTHDETVWLGTQEIYQYHESVDSVTVHEKALAAILEVVISKTHSRLDCVRIPEPHGGVQEWWARMLSGSMNNSHSVEQAQPLSMAAQ